MSQTSIQAINSLFDKPATPRRKAGDGPLSNKKSKTYQYHAIVPGYEVPEVCNQTFNMFTKNDEAYQTHWKILAWYCCCDSKKPALPQRPMKLDLVFFAGDDEIQQDAHNDIETDWLIEEFPDGLVWQWCVASTNGKLCILRNKQ